MIRILRLSDRALPDEGLSQGQLRRIARDEGVGIIGQHVQPRRAVPLHLINDALMRMDERSQLVEQQLAYAFQVALALQHSGEAGQIGLQPVLFGVAVCGQTEVIDHRIDVVLQLRNFAAGLHLDGSRQVALRDGRRDFCDRTDLVGEICGKEVDVARKVLPRARRSGNIGLSAQVCLRRRPRAPPL